MREKNGRERENRTIIGTSPFSLIRDRQNPKERWEEKR